MSFGRSLPSGVTGLQRPTPHSPSARYTRKTMGNLDIIALMLPQLAKPTSLRRRLRKGMPGQVPAPCFLHAMTDKYVCTSTGSPCPHHEGIWVGKVLLSSGSRWKCGQLHAPTTSSRERTTVLIDQEAENCTLLGYYATSSGNFLPTFRDNLSIPIWRAKNPVLHRFSLSEELNSKDFLALKDGTNILSRNAGNK
jgi:hypothetical protein